MGRSFFDQFLDDFFAESEEHVSSARKLMLSIEAFGANTPVDSKTLDELLRNFHSLKGLSAMVGLEEATQLAHHLEDYLKELKNPDTVITEKGLECVVDGINAIESVIEAKRRSTDMPDVSNVLLQLDTVTAQTAARPAAAPRTGAGVWRFVFRPSVELASKGITVTKIRDRLRSFGEVTHASPRVLSDGQVAFEFLLRASVPESAFEELRSQGTEYSRIEDESPALDLLPQPSVEVPSGRAGPLSVVRVEMDRLDDLMRVVGELVISRFRLEEVLRAPAQGSKDWSSLQEINTSMERQLRELREGVVRMRMVPVGQVFERMRFVARGLERELNKRVEIRIDGQDTEIDKAVVERMMDPLLHLVRNAISHGLESVEERRTAGKPDTGVVWLRARTAGDIVTIEVKDDGRGIDVEKITARARGLGWITQDQSLDAKQLLNIISAPGFTTREAADMTSGRGVGMAAVQAALAELGGTMTLETRPREGTIFTIQLPLTLLIADALMVRVAGQRFAIPQTAIREVFSIELSAIKLLENNEVISFRGSVLPVVRLSRLFGLGETEQRRLHLLVIADAGSSTALAVDRITGQREIVVRTITDPLLRVPGVVGATELGDGRPVLILDPYSIIRAARDPHTIGMAS